MKSYIKFGFLALVFSFSFNVAKASHAAGGEIVYECLGNNQYLITLSLYEDCSGSVNLGNTEEVEINSASCGLSYFEILPLISEQEVSPLCDASINNSTCNGGSLPGMIEHIYQGTVTLAPCSDWKFITTVSARNTSANVPGSNSEDYYLTSFLNNTTACNNSPDFTAQPIPYVCLGQSTTYNWGVSEPDGDSLYFDFVCPFGDFGAPLTFNTAGGYACDNPILGININHATGQVVFTPNTTGNFIVAVKVSEYDNNGVLVGEVTRDIQFVVYNCGVSNAPPYDTTGIIENLVGAMQTGDYSFTPCEQDTISFYAVYADPNAIDDIELTSNISQVLPGAIMTVANTGTNIDTAFFTWVVPQGISGSNTDFQVWVKDGACPIQATQTYTYEIDVFKVDAGLDQIICGPGTELWGQATLTASGSAGYTWSVISGDPINIGVNFSCDTCAVVTAIPSITTQYLLSDSNVCNSSDTVMVFVVPDFNFSLSQSTTVGCLFDSVLVAVDADTTFTYTYQWEPAYLFLSPNDSSSILALGEDSTFKPYLIIESDTGCKKSDTLSFTVSSAMQPNIAVAGDANICTNESAFLSVAQLSSIVVLTEDFDGGSLSDGFCNTTGIISNSCGSNSGQALYFANGSGRVLETCPMDLFGQTTVEFYLKIASGLSFTPCEAADAGEGVVLEYSLNGGGNWILIDSYLYNAYPNFTQVTVQLPSAALSSSTMLRWRQPSFSGGSSDNWAMDDVKITVSGGNYDYAWTPNQWLNSDNTPSVIASPPSDISYQVIVSDASGMCADTASVTVTVTPIPTVNITSAASNICEYDAAITLAGTPTPGSWSGNGIAVNGSFDPSLAGAGVHTLVYSHSDNGCSNTDSVDVLVFNAPSAPTVLAANPYCEGEPVALSVSGNGGVLSYYSDAALTIPVNPNAITAQGQTIYVVETSAEGCIGDVGFVSINTIPLPDVNIVSNYSADNARVPVSFFFSNPFTNSSSVTTTWTQDGQVVGNNSNVNLTYLEAGEHTIKITAVDTIAGCSASDEITIVLTEFILNDVPNVFTPNGDGKNDVFVIDAIGATNITLNIYNRWGKRVFGPCGPVNDPIDCAWDGGNHKEGTYYYIITLDNDLGETQNKPDFRGYFSLIRD